MTSIKIIIPHTQCQWFAMCDRDATKTIKHPILGDVPVCERCAKKSGKQS